MSSPGFCSATVSIDEPVTSSHSKSTWIRPAIGEILRRFGGDYLAKYGRRMSSDQRQVMWLLQRCRTGDLGGVLYRCNACRQYHAMPQSCGNRHCPQCQGGRAKEWFEKQKAKLLPCVYFLFTFTVPKQLRRFIRSHPPNVIKRCSTRLPKR